MPLGSKACSVKLEKNLLICHFKRTLYVFEVVAQVRLTSTFTSCTDIYIYFCELVLGNYKKSTIGSANKLPEIIVLTAGQKWATFQEKKSTFFF